MRRERFGRTGVRVPVVGQGTWRMEEDAAASIRALRRGIDLGMTHLDTAEMYGSGRVEEIVGEAVAGRRDEVFLVSKVLPSNASFRGTVEACERSLRRLRTDRLDLYLLHWREGGALAETLRAFERLEGEGKIGAWGASNFDVADLEEAWSAGGAGRIACNQVLYHVGERAIEHAVIPWCERHGVAVVAYSPLAEGNLPAPSTAGGRALAEVARRRGASAAQVALAFLIRRPGTFAIPKATRLDHVEENAGAGDLVLADEEVAILDRAFPRGERKPLPMI
ncbi:MAG TPA: aldo/keto reductase [Planctomycetota bacterium]|jgi:diketogulonate reductase-like aldo/keto reductase|nr:aldo/keto reductase [Planctomycetota bacterium]